MSIFWRNRENWIKNAHNTKWCLIGCAIGDFGTIGYFQFTEHSLSVLTVMLLAMINGLITSIALETVILVRADFFIIEVFFSQF